ncbi:MAG: prenyltransferase/squalene oxidase repeat-containing protein [Candidatus Thorarchaeota archaeon]
MKHGKVAAMAFMLALVLLSAVAVPITANPASRRESLRAYIDAHYDAVDGGYIIPDSEFSQTEPTFAATAILYEWQLVGVRPPIVDWVKMTNFTTKLQRVDDSESKERYGGFAESILASSEVGQKATYDAVNLYGMLELQTDIPGIGDSTINKTAVLVWINETQSVSGGFSSEPGISPDMISTFYALHTMDKVLQDLPGETLDDWLFDRTETVDWIMSSMEGDAFKLSPTSSISGVSSTAAAMMALNILESLPSSTVRQSVLDWILDRQITSSVPGTLIGGFEESVSTNDTNVVSTYWALEALDTFGIVDQVDDEIAARFILDCQAVDGSWGLVPGFDKGTLYYGYYAVRSLGLLGQGDMLLEEDPNNPPLPLFDWRTILAVVVLLAAAAAGFASIRMD